MSFMVEPQIFKVLLVDDRPENLIVLENILEKENRTFIKAASGNEALKMALKNTDIGLIMLDVQMPDMDGFEVAKLLKSNPRTREISIIFVTAISKEEQYVLKGFEEGAVDYLQKPLDIQVTRAKVGVFEQLYFYQAQLRKSLREIESINKQLERFVYTASHDLKSPLAGIATLVSTMEYDFLLKDYKNAESKTVLIKNASIHLTAMVESVLEYSRKSYDQQVKEMVNIRELVEETAYLLFPPPHIHIEISGKLPTFNARKLKLQQVFQNLIGNAIKYNDKKEGRIEVGSTETEHAYLFYVRDNGPGIESHNQSEIFGLFKKGSQATSRESSTGVGLNLLKMLVEEQGGNIWVESFPGEGSTFHFEWMK
jgi:two-component system sensor histidine kinase/response regulator